MMKSNAFHDKKKNPKKLLNFDLKKPPQQLTAEHDDFFRIIIIR